MRHHQKTRRFGRYSAHRQSLFRNLSTSLIEHELIQTTLPKAKELRRVIEPLITLAKTDNLSHRRLLFNRLRNRKAVIKLFLELGPRFKTRPGGYLRIVKKGYRRNDAAPLAMVELLDRKVST